jgi:hypothetical protein
MADQVFAATPWAFAANSVRRLEAAFEPAIFLLHSGFDLSLRLCDAFARVTGPDDTH